MIRSIRSACKSTRAGTTITSNAAIPRWHSATCQHRGDQRNASSIHITRVQKRRRGDATGAIAASTEPSQPSRISVIAPSWKSASYSRMGSCAMSDERPPQRFRTLFISDVHLGARGSQAERLLDFLRGHDADTIYLVGDIVDGWALQSGWYWPQSHNDFVQKMLRKARKGAKIIYVPGNHDEFLRNYYGTHFGGIDVAENTVHVGVDGRRYLVIHGDIFDLVVQNARWLAHLGDKAYDFAIQMNRLVNFFRRMFGVPYWSLSQWAKLKVKNAVNYIGAFEKTLAAEARRHGADGVICGHIHYATIRDAHGIRYTNCGDWVESCTALAEHEDGQFEIITWTDPLRQASPVVSVAARAA